MAWEIARVPRKPTSDATEPPTVDVIAAKVDPKSANQLVRKLNQLSPLEDMHHVKRVRRRIDAEGRTELSIILCLSNGHDDLMEGISFDILQLVESHQLTPFSAKVAKFAAATKEEWEEQCKLWPTSYHPNTNVDNFSEVREEAESIYDFMKLALHLMKSGSNENMVSNVAVIVDPSSKEIIAKATDQVHQTSIHLVESGVDIMDLPSPQCQVIGLALNGGNLNSKNHFSQRDHLCSKVACINPLAWINHEEPSDHSNHKCPRISSWHPLGHAALVAIENAAARDRRLFPCLPNPTIQCDSDGKMDISSDAGVAKRLRREKPEEGHAETWSLKSCSSVPRPYLCTGFDMYLVWEPCAMCAMALVHQRFRRIFYAFPNLSMGALGSVHHLHGEKSLNHHYSVFRIFVPDDSADNRETHSNAGDCSQLAK